jgi:hypothetical protein
LFVHVVHGAGRRVDDRREPPRREPC